MKTPAARRTGRQVFQLSPISWDARYSTGRASWRSKGIGPLVRRYLRYSSPGSPLLEIGYGLGDDALELIDLGFDYSGIDLSPAATIEAAKRLKLRNANLVVGDFLNWRSRRRYKVIYDKGVFHGIAGKRRRLAFSRRVAHLLQRNGLWITVCGSADYYDPNLPHGALYLTQLVEAVEPYFEISHLQKSNYGVRTAELDFEAWFGLFRRLRDS
jgi:hypothetical protein